MSRNNLVEDWLAGRVSDRYMEYLMRITNEASL